MLTPEEYLNPIQYLAPAFRILSGTSINTNLGHSTLTFLALINVACKLA